MKIVMIGQKGAPAVYGGIERHVEELAVELARMGHEVICYCRSWYSRQFQTGHRGLSLINLPSIRTKHLDAASHTFLATLHACLFIRPEIYHYHGVGPALFAWLPRLARPGARVVVTFHCLDRVLSKWGFFSRLILRLGEWAACHFAHETITVSRTLFDYCQKTYHRTTQYLPSGAREPKPSAALLISQFGLEPQKYVAFVGRLLPYKGLDLLLEAWRALSQHRPDLVKDLKLVLVGQAAGDPVYQKHLEAAAREQSDLILTGNQTGAILSQLYAQALFIVHPSFSEGLPMSVLEAMSHGRVVLASDIPSHQEILGPHGVTFRSGDRIDLEEKLAALIESSDALSAIGEQARVYVLKHYSWEKIAHQLQNLYLASLNGQPGRDPRPEDLPGAPWSEPALRFPEGKR